MTTLTLDIVANDRGAARTVKDLGEKVEDTGNRMQRWRSGAGIIAATGAAFGVVKGIASGVTGVFRDATSAYVEAEQAQLRLQDAFTRFPALADTNIAALEALNASLMRKTRFDDDAIATGQAVLAQFSLTGQQLKDITPLLLDYAAKTGQDVPNAAEKLGKAFLGNTKALKELGIEYKSTGDQAKDTENIVNLLRGAVGGFAEKEGQTAAGRAEILKNTFGEIQEEIGQRLMPIFQALGEFLLTHVVPAIETLVQWFQENLAPVLMAVFNWIKQNVFPILSELGSFLGATLVPVLQAAAQWFKENWSVISALAIVVAAMVAPIVAVSAAKDLWALKTQAVTKAQDLLNLAMKANPILLIVSLIAGLVAAFIVLWNKSEGFRNFFIGAWQGIQTVVGAVVGFIVAAWNGFVGFFTGAASKIAQFASNMWEGAKKAALAVKDWIVARWNDLVSFFTSIPQKIGAALGGLARAIGDAFKFALNIAIDVINFFIDRANDIIYGINLINPFEDIPSIPRLKRLHEGGVVPGSPGTERIAILEAGETVLPADTRGAGGVVTVRLVVDGADTELLRLLRRMVRIEGAGNVQAAFGRG